MARVYLEVGKKKVFACALEWPGWARSGRTEELALTALDDYADRYADVCSVAGVRFPADREYVVVERVAGNATTDFGAPDRVPDADLTAVSAAEAKRASGLVRASWEVFDRIAAESPESLRKGPRGGGRDRDKMIDHVLGAEASYARKLGVRHKQPALGDSEAIEALRADIVAVLAKPSPDGAGVVPRGWPVRYAARRIAWHVLDHAWEMEDRAS
ncbi:hypothetical protein Val02_25900 [Virgisporangium aliadipatigenens]|uniref:DinB family protein n=1 Tax=Virgisporangium aliadipatigenens TaxID=741659 RepID=A0A8J3YI39_9ACTN|nr:hypothetical protein [Virgisporangium aliadipatigenens]GIJ45704.1 hypothetical protein Val02_25900 [Virgisporangium aliadipatigenens]